jgi:hypothetical protein
VASDKETVKIYRIRREMTYNKAFAFSAFNFNEYLLDSIAVCRSSKSDPGSFWRSFGCCVSSY